MLAFSTMWRHVRLLTNKDVEKRAVMELIYFTEELIDKVINQSLREQEEINDLKKKQGIYAKSRLDEACVKRSIQTIMNGRNIFSSDIGGKHEGESNEYANDECRTQGVEII